MSQNLTTRGTAKSAVILNEVKDLKMKQYYAYIVTNKSKTLYTGVTGDLSNRVFEHKNHLVPGFTSKYKVDRLVHFESPVDIHEALKCEKQVKGWLRSKKIALIESPNPKWEDLSRGF